MAIVKSFIKYLEKNTFTKYINSHNLEYPIFYIRKNIVFYFSDLDVINNNTIYGGVIIFESSYSYEYIIYILKYDNIHPYISHYYNNLYDDNITDIKVSYKYIIESYYDVLKNIDKHSNIEYNNNSYIISNILYNFTSQSNKRKLEDNYEIYDNYLVKRCKTINNFYNNNKRKLEDTYENYDNYMGKRCN